MLNKLYSLFIISILFVFAAYPQQNEDFLAKLIDNSVKPGDDFTKYATGKWMKENPIPANESGWSIAHLVQEETYNRLNSILEETSKKSNPKGSSDQKIGDFYFSGMDTVTIEKLGITPIQNEIEMIKSLKNKKDLSKLTAYLHKIGVNIFFGPFVEQDAKNSEQYALYFWQSGLGLPQRDYYFKTDERIVKIRDEYQKYLSNMLTLSNSKPDNSIFKLETLLADSSRKLEDLRDPYLNYNKMSLSDLNKIAPDFNWSVYFSEIGLKNIKDVIVGQPEFLRQFNKVIKDFSVDQIKEYLLFHLVDSYASTLNKKFVDERFRFRNTVISGIKEQRPRWKRIQDNTESNLGELLGQIYVKKFYSPETKKRYERLVEDIVSAYGERIKNLDWMSEVTKQKALSKLAKVTKKVGYPEKWKDFSKLEINRNEYARNTLNANVFWFNYMINKYGKPVDRTEWSMTPQTYNAYYNPSNNEIVLPAAIFIIPGTPDSLIDDAVVYSYAGASTIGHEIIHGFDDQGRQYDANGNLTDWWTKEDEQKFNEKAKLMIEQFSEYVVLDSMHINGEATLGENIADLGGLVIAYDAFKKTPQFKENKIIAGLTPTQRFFLGYALAWLGHIRPESLMRQVLTDVHSPAFLRINGPVSDIDEFYKAFNVKEGDKLFRPVEKRVKIW